MHIYNNWASFASFLDNSNWASLFLGILIPTIPVTLYVRWEHKKTRLHHEHLFHTLRSLESKVETNRVGIERLDANDAASPSGSPRADEGNENASTIRNEGT